MVKRKERENRSPFLFLVHFLYKALGRIIVCDPVEDIHGEGSHAKSGNLFTHPLKVFLGLNLSREGCEYLSRTTTSYLNEGDIMYVS